MAKNIAIKLEEKKIIIMCDGVTTFYNFEEKLEMFDENGDLMFVRPFDKEKLFRGN